MWDIIAVVGLLAFVVFIVMGIVSAIKKNGKWKRNFLISGISVVIFFIGVSNSPTGKSDKQANPLTSAPASESASPTATADASAKAKKVAEEKAKADEAAKLKAAEEAKAIEQADLAVHDAVIHPHWNMSEVDAAKNGNVLLAMNMIKEIKTVPDGATVTPQKVHKTPWNYYGKPISFSGTVGVVDDYPPDSDQGKSGISSEIVIECDDGTIVDYFEMVPSGEIKIGDNVNITAYPVGRTEVPNKLGGNFTHLIVVTNRIN